MCVKINTESWLLQIPVLVTQSQMALQYHRLELLQSCYSELNLVGGKDHLFNNLLLLRVMIKKLYMLLYQVYQMGGVKIHLYKDLV